MIVYFDASALVKRFVREMGTEVVQAASIEKIKTGGTTSYICPRCQAL